MAKRRTSKKKIRKQVISAVIVVILAILAYFLEPWQYITGEEKSDVGSRTEITSTDLQIHYIDVGQADSILVRVPVDGGMKNMLIDAGTAENYPASNIIDYLSDLGISSLDYFVITHPHLDHIGAADEVIHTFDVKTVSMPEGEAATKAWENVLVAIDENDVDTDISSKAGDTYTMGDASFKILGPIDPANEKETNNYSIVMRLVYGETALMFTGDAETDSEEEILARFSASEFSADVLKAGHHGSTTSTSEEFLKAASPSLAIISCGEGNSYGHPHDEILERLQNAGVEIPRTDLEGDIIICSDKTEVYRLTSN